LISPIPLLPSRGLSLTGSSGIWTRAPNFHNGIGTNIQLTQGKKPVLVTLTEENMVKAKTREGNFSGLLDRLLSEWLNHG
jgi:hypothetical protein